ncbi:MAG: hypothetical protein CMG59_02340 [Candidatus Marinimicrobia bacterium]|nr:hypothetical protein [Candidatus Neomarinimicrobiota bacterium]
MTDPLISILMPVYNQEEYITSAIKSVLNQTYTNFELIIINDGSSDNTLKKIQSFRDKRISVYNPGKIGKIKAFNLAYSKSKGKFISLFAGDDTLVKNSLQLRINPILENSNVPMISLCKLRTFSKNKKFNGLIIPKHKNGNMSGGTIMFNNELSKMCFPIPISLGNEDMWIIQHALRFNKVVIKHVPFVGINYRIHDKNSIGFEKNFTDKSKILKERNVVYKVFLSKYFKEIDHKARLELQALTEAEHLRFKSNWFSIIFIKNLSLIQKLQFISYSNSFFYSLRNKLYSFFSRLRN